MVYIVYLRTTEICMSGLEADQAVESHIESGLDRPDAQAGLDRCTPPLAELGTMAR